MKLKQCLANVPFRNLLIIARLHGVQRGHNPSKARLVELLTTALKQPETLQRTLQRLTLDQRRALDALIAAGGEMPWPTFRDAFGDIRAYRPWREDAPRQPWQDPVSPAEALWFRGLIYRVSHQGAGAGVREWVVIPEDLLPLLPSRPKRPALSEQLELLAEREPTPDSEDVATDVALLISLLHREDVRPIWGRWLPPRYLRDLNWRLSASEDMTHVRSELQTGRLRFVHFLAEAAGLVDLAGGWLKPTPRAWAWLDQTRPARYQALWAAWQARSDDNAALWQRYRLPGWDAEGTLDILGVVLNHLAELPAGQWYSETSFVTTLVAMEPALSGLPAAWRGDEAYDRGQEVVSELIQGPLSWWGIVAIGGQGEGPAFSVTPLGRWLLTGDGVDPPMDDTAFQVSPTFKVLVSDRVPPRDWVRIEALAEWRGWAGDQRCYQVTQDSIGRALSRSMSLQEIIDTLSRGWGGELTSEQVDTLKAWALEAQAVRLRTTVLLEVREAQRLQELGTQRAIRRHFRDTLSPRAVAVDAGRIDRLVRALRREGVWPQVDLPPAEAAGRWPPEAGAAAWMWIAGRVYAELARWIELPQPMPVAVLDEVAAHMKPETYAAAHQVVEDVIERLADAMDGWARHPMPGAGLPPEETLPIIERAIVEGRTLHITYWTAGRGERSKRTVEPYRVEWRGDVPYLVGYCHERLADRVFRLDRIQAIEPTRA